MHHLFLIPVLSLMLVAPFIADFLLDDRPLVGSRTRLEKGPRR
ncbi:hypothetical protein GCM10020218_041220 [Dactylosporangium vinaceum]|uniref:Uncharacterized protein n=1 Tax=Dactylosporangium vinaceum TaxID=53362 RepID=A0ABV5MME7_9ACTN|nr:hypothetical protein [Dactylosporangium vinaceum]